MASRGEGVIQSINIRPNVLIWHGIFFSPPNYRAENSIDRPDFTRGTSLHFPCYLPSASVLEYSGHETYWRSGDKSMIVKI